MKKYLLTLAVLCLPTLAHAQEVGGITLEKGQTMLSLSATEQVDLQQDLLQGSLRMEVTGKDAKTVQDQINKAVQQALALTKGVKEVKTSTGNYNVYSYDPNPEPRSADKIVKDAAKNMVWKGSQTIDMQSRDQAKLLELAGKIQELGFAMNGLNYTLSPEQQETYRDNLMTSALKKIQAKADLATKALGKSSYDIVEVNVDGASPIQPMPVMFKAARMEMAGASADMAAPNAQAGEQTVSLTVTARVVLKP